MSSSERGQLGDVVKQTRSELTGSELTGGELPGGELPGGELTGGELTGGWAGRRWLSLGFAVLGVLLIWGAILPWISGQPVMRRTWERWHQQGVDPSVRFYTELPVSDPVARRLEGR